MAHSGFLAWIAMRKSYVVDTRVHDGKLHVCVKEAPYRENQNSAEPWHPKSPASP